MNETLYREKSLKNISSPEELNDYLRMNNPSVWVVLASAIIFLFGLLVWASVGNLETKANAYVEVKDSEAIVYVYGDNASLTKDGMVLRIDGAEGSLRGVSMDEYGRITARAAVNVPDGRYEAEVIVESFRPISFLFR